MSPDPAAVVIGAVGCGAVGLLVPRLIGRVPEPPPDPEHPKPTYAAVAARRGLARTAAVLCALAGAVVGTAIGLDWPLLLVLPLVPVAVALGTIDLHTRLLPTILVWPMLGLAALLGTAAALLDDDLGALVRAAVGAAVVLAVFYALWWVHPAGLGFGDVRLSSVLGFVLGYLGWPALVVGVYAGFLAFAVPGLLLALVRRRRDVLRASYPFGPFLLVGALVGLALGGPLWRHLVGG